MGQRVDFMCLSLPAFPIGSCFPNYIPELARLQSSITLGRTTVGNGTNHK